MHAEVKTRAVVIKSLPYGESDLIITFLSEDAGVMRGMAKGARKSRKRFAGCFEPFTLIGLGCALKDSGGLAGVRSADIIKPFYGIRKDLDRIIAGARVLELAAEVEVRGEEAREAFALLEGTLEILESSSGPSSLSGIFFIKYLGVSGFKASWGACSRCGSVLSGKGASYRGGHGLLCRGCSGDGKAVNIGPGCTAFIARAEGIRLENMGRLRLPAEAEAELFGFLKRYVSAVIGKSLKSLDIIT